MVGLTLLLQVPLPVPVTVPPLLSNARDHNPLAVMVPLMFVLLPLQMVVLALVMAAMGRGFTTTVLVLLTATHSPAGLLVVKVKTTVPA